MKLARSRSPASAAMLIRKVPSALARTVAGSRSGLFKFAKCTRVPGGRSTGPTRAAPRRVADVIDQAHLDAAIIAGAADHCGAEERDEELIDHAEVDPPEDVHSTASGGVERAARSLLGQRQERAGHERSQRHAGDVDLAVGATDIEDAIAVEIALLAVDAPTAIVVLTEGSKNPGQLREVDHGLAKDVAHRGNVACEGLFAGG